MSARALKRGGYITPVVANHSVSSLDPAVGGGTLGVGTRIVAPDCSVVVGRNVDPSGLLGEQCVLIGNHVQHQGSYSTAIGHGSTVQDSSVALGWNAMAGAEQCVLGGPKPRHWVLGQPGTLTVPQAEDDVAAAVAGVPVGGIYVRADSSLALRKA